MTPRRWEGRELRAAVDASLAVGVAVVVVGLAANGTEAGARVPDTTAYALAVATSLLLVARRRWPLAVLLAVVGVSTYYHALGYPGGATQPAMYVALYTAAAAGRRWWSLAVLAVTGLGGAGFRLLVEGEALFSIGLLADTGLMVASWALGLSAYHHHRWRQEAQESLRHAEVERELEAQRRVADERLRIARELHDIIAHTVAVITVQASVAKDTFDDSPAQAKQALDAIRTASREATDELRATIDLLREGDGDAPTAPAPGLRQLDGLLRAASGAGVPVELAVDGPARPLPAAVDLTAYRIVQESLTNVIRHAAATRAGVAIAYQPGAVLIEVTDDGHGPNGTAGKPSHGLAGMRERAEAIGGWLEAGPAPTRGFLVRASLPTDRRNA